MVIFKINICLWGIVFKVLIDFINKVYIDWRY